MVIGISTKIGKKATLGHVINCVVDGADPNGAVTDREKVKVVVVRTRKEVRRSDGTYVRFLAEPDMKKMEAAVQRTQKYVGGLSRKSPKRSKEEKARLQREADVREEQEAKMADFLASNLPAQGSQNKTSPDQRGSGEPNVTYEEIVEIIHRGNAQLKNLQEDLTNLQKKRREISFDKFKEAYNLSENTGMQYLREWNAVENNIKEINVKIRKTTASLEDWENLIIDRALKRSRKNPLDKEIQI